MIFKSRTTKQLSNVIEQNALSRSPGSSMSLMRTSVISTVVLLAITRDLLATARGVDKPQLPRSKNSWPNAVRAVHGDKRRNKPIHCPKADAPQNPVGRRPSEAYRPRATAKPPLPAGDSASTGQDLADRSSAASSSASDDAAAGGVAVPSVRQRVVSAINFAGAQADRRLNDHEVQAAQSAAVARLARRARGKSRRRSPRKTARRCRARPPTSASRSFDQLMFQPRFASRSAAAASLDPPPKPAAAGIRFTNSTRAPNRSRCAAATAPVREQQDYLSPSESAHLGLRDRTGQQVRTSS